jgi:hypothetical protein
MAAITKNRNFFKWPKLLYCIDKKKKKNSLDNINILPLDEGVKVD